MTELLTAAQMKATEQAAIAAGSVTGLELMERAGAGVVAAAFEEWPALAEGTHRAVVLCGPGNNGGDGFVVARLLAQAGWSVEVFFYGDVEKLPPDAKANHARWCEIGEVHRYVDKGRDAFWLAPEAWGRDDLIVDALFGTGLGRSVAGFDAFGRATQMSGRRSGEMSEGDRDDPGPHVVAIDLPSGLCADSGRYLRDGEMDRDHEDIRAHLTVSFHRLKSGHVLAEGPVSCGKTVVKDIGLEGGAERLGAGDVIHLRDTPPDITKQSGNKYDHGHALILTGGSGRTGAARLAARGALRIGAGLVTLGVPPSAQMEVASQIAALMLTRVADAGALEAVLQDVRINTVCLGPGLGLERARALVPVAVRHEGAPYVVLDADALTAFADDPQVLFGMLHQGCVLTPHGGEFARLFPDIAERLIALPKRGPAYSKVDATRDAAARCGAVVLFKGADTVIAHPDGRASVHAATHARSAPWLATAGAGDVLAGFIAGLMARRLEPMAACEAAAWLHVECARTFGAGLIAEDLAEVLPQVLGGVRS